MCVQYSFYLLKFRDWNQNRKETGFWNLKTEKNSGTGTGIKNFKFKKKITRTGTRIPPVDF